MRPDLLSNIYVVKNFLGETDETNDANIELMMDSVLGEIESYVGRSLKMQRYVFTRNWQSRIILPNMPLMGVESIIAGTDTLVFDNDYRVNLQKSTVYPYSLGNSPTGLGAVRITYDAGYFEARVTSNNNKIDFEETASSELTATVAVGQYNNPETDGSTYIKSPATLLAEAIQTALNAAGASAYTVTYDAYSNRFTITSDLAGGGGIFNLLWTTGTNAQSTIGNLLGFDVTDDDTGAATYESDTNDDCAPIVLRSTFLNFCRVAWERHNHDNLLASVASEQIPDGSSITWRYNFDINTLLPSLVKGLDRFQRIYL
jgi:hypothetical protein